MRPGRMPVHRDTPLYAAGINIPLKRVFIVHCCGTHCHSMTVQCHATSSHNICELSVERRVAHSLILTIEFEILTGNIALKQYSFVIALTSNFLLKIIY